MLQWKINLPGLLVEASILIIGIHCIIEYLEVLPSPFLPYDFVKQSIHTFFAACWRSGPYTTSNFSCQAPTYCRKYWWFSMTSFSLKWFPTKPWRARLLDLKWFHYLFCDGLHFCIKQWTVTNLCDLKWWVLFLDVVKRIMFCYHKEFEVLPINTKACDEHI